MQWGVTFQQANFESSYTCQKAALYERPSENLETICKCASTPGSEGEQREKGDMEEKDAANANARRRTV
jgi:hypothetical protein